jgi:predicted secreted hydrolase
MLLLASVAIAALAYWVMPALQANAPPEEAVGAPDLMSLNGSLSEEGFERPSPTWKLSLPRDHGAHLASRMEIWQLSTHLQNEKGELSAFQFSFLRLGVVPPSAPPPTSVWEVRELYRGHVTFTDAELDQAVGEERLARGMPRLAGYDADAGEIRLDNWFLRFGHDHASPELNLYATVRDKAVVKLVMRPEKTAVALEPEGNNALFVGYSLTRLTVEGVVDRGRGEETVSGTAWLDHSWGDLPLPGVGPVAQDRLLFQLDDGTDFSVVRSRRTDGRGSPSMIAMVVAPDGIVSTFDDEDDENVQMTTTRTWRHKATGTEYPVAWHLEAPELDIYIEPLIDAQIHDFSTPFWSGVVTLTGTWRDISVSGTGTLLLTGYDQ